MPPLSAAYFQALLTIARGLSRLRRRKMRIVKCMCVCVCVGTARVNARERDKRVAMFSNVCANGRYVGSWENTVRCISTRLRNYKMREGPVTLSLDRIVRAHLVT